MPRFKIKHTAPVWEETFIEVEVTEEEAERIRDRDMDLIDDLLNNAVLNDQATIQVAGGIDSLDADYDIEEDK